MRKIVKSFVLVFVFFILFFFLIKSTDNNNYIKYVKIAGQDIKVELALTEEAQTRGLSGRTELKEQEGMLFIFAKPDKYYFWMKGMNFPIDMIWIDKNMKVIYIKNNAQPESYLETYGPDANAKYVLEVVAGFSDKNNLKEGDDVLFTY